MKKEISLEEKRRRWRIYSNRYYKKNKDKRLPSMRKYAKKYYINHRDNILIKKREYRIKNREIIKERNKHPRVKERNRKWWRKRYIKFKKRPKHKLSNLISKGMYISLKGNKGGVHWECLVGYTTKDLINHLEKQFKKGMSWINHGSYWHIDHRIPISKFNFTSFKDKEFKKCWALENLQPLETKNNLKKGNSYSEPTLNQISF